MKKKALFLDRDGVINEDLGYVHQIEEFNFIPGIFDLCRAAILRKYTLVVVTNQAGIGRGLYSEQAFDHLTAWMCDQFSRADAPISRVYFCPDHPVFGIGPYKRDSQLRKPNPGMILRARDELSIDLSNSVLLGDKESDIEVGLRAGVGCTVRFCPIEVDTKAHWRVRNHLDCIPLL